LLLGSNGKALLHGDFGTAVQCQLGINLGNTYTAPSATLHVKGEGTTTAVTLLVETSGGADRFKMTDDGNFMIGNSCGLPTHETSTCVGSYAGTNIGATTYSTHIGMFAGYTSTGVSTTTLGAEAGKILASTTGNTCLGRQAGYVLAAGNNNVAVGLLALGTQADSSENTGVGYSAGKGMASSNTDSNVYIGAYSGYYADTAANKNTYVGFFAGKGHSSGSAGDSNVAVGYGSMGATDVFTSGTNNVCVGYNSGDAISTGDANTCIGYGADAAATINHQLAIGMTAVTTGEFGIAIGNNVSAATNDCVIGKNGYAITVDFDADATWAYSSDLRKKNVIGNDSLGLSFINALTTKTYKWKPASEHPEEWGHFTTDEETGVKTYVDTNTDVVMHGLIAQEVKAALDAAGCSTFAGWKEDENGQQSIAKAMFVIPLIKAIQELSAKVTALENA
jgi:hypothetical protein